MRFDLAPYLDPRIGGHIQGSTDSEWIYALTLSALEDPFAINPPEAILAAVRQALSVIREVRARHGIERSSSSNLIFCDGINMVAVRYTFDFGRFDERQLQGTTEYLSMWYSFGRDYGLHDGPHGEEWGLSGSAADADSIIVASEPLTRDFATWLEVPEYSALLVRRDGMFRRAEIHALEI
jgi:glutamine amidotransferase